MSTDANHVNHHQRDTIDHIFRHPTSHNVRWVDVVSLLHAVADTEERHDGKIRVSLGGEIHTFEQPRHKDIDTEMIMTLRRMLKAAGYAPEGKDHSVIEPKADAAE